MWIESFERPLITGSRGQDATGALLVDETPEKERNSIAGGLP
jgi:hypothetical protein